MLKITPHKALATLTRLRLFAIAAALEVVLPAGGRKREVVDALLSSPNVTFETVLSALTHDELATICRRGGIDTTGADRSQLVDRILGRERPPFQGNGKPPGKPRAPDLPQVLNPDSEDQLTLRQLEAHLWEAANILRGKIDSSDFRHYIFGLLFYKRISDVWEEEYEDRLRVLGDPALATDPEEHRFHLPEHVLWKNARRFTTNIGERLNQAFRAIEAANPRLAGVFQHVNFNNKERFPDSTLEMLLRHFEKFRLRNSDVEPDMLGNAYEYLIAQFADDAGKKGGEFYTPKRVVRLIVECLRPREGMSVYDPACGSGGMLLEAVHYLERYGQDHKSLRLCGQEMNLNTWAICQMNLFLHDIDDALVLRGDTLRLPKHLIEGTQKLKAFDRVLANPPFSLKNWGHEVWKDGDAYGRDRYGCPPRAYGDLAFLQHMLASLAPDGMLGVVLPHGVLFRGGSEGIIRRGLVEDDLIEAIVGLAPNLFYGTGIPACVVIVNRKKPAARRDRVLFVNGVGEMEQGKNQNYLSEANVEKMAHAFHAFRHVPGFARVVARADIAANDYNLSINRYVQELPSAASAPGDLTVELRAYRQLRAQRDAAEVELLDMLARLGYCTEEDAADGAPGAGGEPPAGGEEP